MRLLALHGFTGCGADFAPLAELCGGKWHCPDLPGHGPEPQPDCSPAAMVEFIARQHSTLNSQATTPQVLLGYSMGARAALLHAIQYPEAWSALILISPNPGIEDDLARRQRRSSDASLAEMIERKGVANFLEFWQQTPLIRSQQRIPFDWRERMQANRQKHEAKGLAQNLLQFGQGSFPNLWPKLPQLKTPVCLITGAMDSKYSEIAERMLKRLHSTLSIHSVITGASHMPHLEQADKTAEIIRSFEQA